MFSKKKHKLTLLHLLIFILFVVYAISNSLIDTDFTLSMKLESPTKSIIFEKEISTFYIDKSISSPSILKQNIPPNSNTFHLISHGRPGELLINGKWLNPKQIANFVAAKFRTQKSIFKNLNIYGCEFAKGNKGQQAIAYLEDILNIKIAASTNITGIAGDWLLEIGQINTNIKTYNYNLQVPNTGSNDDYDGDNVINSEDLDDDNDGILDTDECLINTSEIPIPFGTNNQDGNYLLSNGVWVIQDLFGTNVLNNTNSTNDDGNLTSNSNSGVDLVFSEPVEIILTYTTNNNPPHFGEGTNSNHERWFLELNSGEFFTIENPTGSITPSEGITSNSSTATYTNEEKLLVRSTSGYDPIDWRIKSSPTTHIKATLLDGNSAGDIRIQIKRILDINNDGFCDIDSDGDNIPNVIDLDSDGDGCPDAVEGGGSYVFEDLVTDTSFNGGSTNVQQNLGTTVDTNGVPNTDNTVNTDDSQTVGESQTNSEDTACCEDPTNYSSITDTDGDNLGDGCDLDDDNDGIFDVDENCTSQTVAFNGSGWLAPNGTDPGITISVTNSATSSTITERTLTTGQNYIVDNFYKFISYNDILIDPAGTTNSSTVTFTFSSPVKANEVGIYLGDVGTDNSTGSIGINGGTATTYDFQWVETTSDNSYEAAGFLNPLNYVNSTGNFTFPNLNTGEYSHNILIGNSEKTLTSLTLTIDNLGSGDLIATKLLPIIGCDNDFDGDGISNYLDLDSDADGCPDAVEGGLDFTFDDLEENTTMNGGTTNVQHNLGAIVDADGIPNTDDDITTDNSQTLGNSQNYSTDTECCPESSNYSTILDFDSDNIGDGCDLDDDNDGILDLEEGFCNSAEVNFEFGTTTVSNSDFDISSNVDYTQMQTLQGQPSPTAPKIFLNGFDKVAGGSVFDHTFATPQKIWIDGNGKITVVIQYYNNISNKTGQYTTSSRDFNLKINSTTAPLLLGSFTISSADASILNDGGWVQYTIVFDTNVIPYSIVEIEGITGKIEGNSQGQPGAFDPNNTEVFALSIGDISGCTNSLDTDNDGIPNYHDLDSDDDGCPDAIEGGGDYDSTDLVVSSIPVGDTNITQNLGTAVDVEGIPNTDDDLDTDDSQTVGDSQTYSTDTACCEDADNYTPITDTDGDNIGDDCDLDDDNDGITDFAECGISARALTLVDFGAPANTNGQTITNKDISSLWSLPTGSIIVNVTDFNSGANGYYVDDTSSSQFVFSGTVNVFIEISHGPNVSDGDSDGIIVNDNINYTFTSTLDTGLTHIQTGTTYTVSNNSGAAITNSERLNWSSNGVATKITITSTANNSGYKINIKPDYCKDTDNDGISNELDIDSDNDGCPDAVEAAGNFTQSNLTSSNNLADADEGSVDSDGIPITDTDDNNISAATPQNNTTAVTTNEELTIESITPASSTSYCVGENVTFTATASGTTVTNFTTDPNTTTALAASAINYQWYESTNGGTTFTAITGQTNSTLILTNVQVSTPAKQYKIEITSANNGCPEESTVTLNVIALPTADAGTDFTKTCTTNTSGKTIGTTPATGYSYSWSPTTGLSDHEIANPNANPNETTTYTLTITDDTNGCTDTDTVTVTVNTTDPTADAGQPKTIDCNTTEVTIGPDSETTGFTYSWDNADSLSESNVWNPTATPSETTTYTLTYTNDETGCSDQATVTVTVNDDLPTAEAGEDQTIDCNTTSVVIGVVSTTGYTYSWSPTAGLDNPNNSNPTATPSSTEIYTVLITNTTTGCTNTDAVTVTVNNDLPTANAGTDFTKTCTTNTSGKTIGTTPATGYSYSWSPTTGLSDHEIANPNANPNTTTTYTLTITDDTNGCTDTDTVTVTVNTTDPTADAGQPKTIDCNTTEVTIGPDSETTGFTYSWDNADSLSESNVWNPTATPSETTTYTLTYTNDETGCSDQATVTVTVNDDLPTAEAGEDQTIDCNTTSVVIGVVSTTGYTYSWSPSAGLDNPNSSNPTATPSSTETYTVLITNTTTGCTNTDAVTVTVNNDLPTANAGEDQIIDCNTTSVTIGANSVDGYTYIWSPSTGLDNINSSNPTATPTSTETYTVEVTETATGCKATDDVTVEVNNAMPTADAGQPKTIDCNTTEVTIGPDSETTGFTYSWDNADSLSDSNVWNPTATPSETTTYTLTYTNDETGCSDQTTVTVTVNDDLPTAEAGEDQTIDCNTTSVVIGVVSTTGYTYSWSPSAGLDNPNSSNPTATPSSTETYTVLITNTTTGCTNTDAVTVTVNNDLPTVNAGEDFTITCIANTSGKTIGTTPTTGYSYSWSPTTGLSEDDIANPNANPNETTTYTLTITDDTNGCTDTDTVTVTVNTTDPTADAGQPKTIDCNTTEVTIGPDSETTGFTYSWDNADSLSDSNVWNPTATPSETTTYTLTYTNDETGCSDQATVTVTVNDDLPTAEAGEDQTFDCNTTSVVIGVASTTGYTYSWSPTAGLDNPNSSNPTATPSSTETYTVLITNTITGCTNTDAVTVTVNNDLPTANAGEDQIIDCNTTSVTIGADSIDGYTYVWSPSTGLDNINGSNPTATPSETTTYTVEVTETATGCKATDDVTVEVNNAMPTADAGQPKTIDCNTTEVTIGPDSETTGFTYSWDNADSLSDSNVWNPTATPSETTAYTLTYTNDETGCSDQATVTVTVNDDLPTAEAGEDQTIDCNTTSVVIGVASTTGYTYSWSPTAGLDNPNSSNPTATPSSTETYTVLIKNTTTGCTNTDAVTVTVNNDLPTANAGENQIIDCNTTSVTIGANSVDGYTYIWSPSTGLDNINGSNPTATPSETTTYTVEVTDDINGCTDTDTVTVTVNTTDPTADAGQPKTIDCNTTEVTIGPDSETTGFTYSWDNADSLSDSNVWNPTATPSETTTYTLTYTNDETGCSDQATVTVTVNDDLPTAEAGEDQTIDCNTTSVVIGVASTTGYTYSWSPSAGLDNPNSSNPTATPSSTETYTVLITNTTTGCTNTDAVTVTVNNDLPTADAGENQIIDCNTTSVTIGANSVDGYTYIWSPSTGLNNINSSNPTATPTSTETYTVEVTETATGCKATDDVTVEVNNAMPTADAGQPKTIDCNTTEVTIGPDSETTGFTYSWDNADSLSDSNVWNPTATPSETTTYTLTYTNDETGCSDQATVTVTVNDDLPTAEAGEDQTIDCNTTSVVIGVVSTTGYTYSWSPSAGLDNPNSSNPTATPSSTETYTVLITNTTTGCTNTDAVTVTVNNDLPTANAGENQIIDCNTTSVTIGADSVDGYTYIWSPSTGLDNINNSNPTATLNETTTYTVEVTETATGCKATDDVTVEVNNAMPNADAGQPKTIDCNTTEVTIGPDSETTGFTYSWDNADSLSESNVWNPTATPSETTTYTLTYTNDETGCSDQATVTVTVNDDLPTAEAGEDQTIDCNTTSVVIGVASTTGYTYSWSPTAGLDNPNSSNPTATPSSTETYTVLIKNTTTGCTNTDAVTVTVNNDLPTANAGENQIIDCNTTSVTIGANSVDGYTYIWSPSTGLDNINSSNPTATPSETTTYTVEVTETATGCKATDDVTVEVNNAMPTADAGQPKTIDCNTTEVTIGPDSETTGFTYSWDNADSLSDSNVWNPTATPSETTTYTLTYTNDETGCSNQATVTVTVNDDLPTAEAGEDQTIDCNTTSVVIGVASTTGYTYSWSPSAGLDNSNSSNPTATPNTTTTYSLIITNESNGCSASDSVEVTVNNTTPTANAGNDQTIDCNTTSVSIGSSNISGFTYQWSPIAGLDNPTISNPTATPTETTTYTVEIINTVTGCSNTDDVIVTIALEHSPRLTAPNDLILEGCIANATTVTATNSGFEYSETLVTLTESQIATFLNLENASITEVCDYSVTYIDTQQINSCDKVITRTYTVTNSYGLTDTATQQIIVSDTSPPTFLQTVEPSIFVVCNTIPEAQTLAAIDNCTIIPNVTFSTQTTTVDSENYIIERIWVATDDCNNQATTTQLVYVKKTSETLTKTFNLCSTDNAIDLNELFNNGALNTENSIWINNETNTETSSVFIPYELELGSYQISSNTSENGCTLERIVYITINNDCLVAPCISSTDDITVSTLVSPNGDNKNDTFTIDLAINPDSKYQCDFNVNLEIYNRWGALIYKNENYNNDWFGESPNDAFGSKNKLPQTTYYYIIKLETSDIPAIQGFFLLGK